MSILAFNYYTYFFMVKMGQYPGFEFCETGNVLLGGGIYGFLRCFRQLSNRETLCLIILSKFTRVDQGPVEGRAELGILSKVFLKKLGGGVGYMYTDSVNFILTSSQDLKCENRS